MIKKILFESSISRLNLLMANSVRDGWTIEERSFSESKGCFTVTALTEVEDILLPLEGDCQELRAAAKAHYESGKPNDFGLDRAIPQPFVIQTLESETRYEGCTTFESSHFDFKGEKFALARCIRRQFEAPFIAVISYQVPLTPARQSHTVYQR
jgi:hypothetical protein